MIYYVQSQADSHKELNDLACTIGISRKEEEPTSQGSRRWSPY